MVRDIEELGAQGGSQAMETIRQVNPDDSRVIFHRDAVSPSALGSWAVMKKALYVHLVIAFSGGVGFCE